MNWKLLLPTRRKFLTAVGIAAASLTTFPYAISAADVSSKTYEETVAKAVEFLRVKGQGADGSFSPQGTGPTGIVTTALLRHGRSPSDPMVAKSLKFLEKHVRADGGIYAEGSKHQNYETCIAVMAFNAANKDGKYDTIIANADKFLKQLQWGEKDKIEKTNPAYGGGGYGSHNRPDLSNTSFLIDALKAAGNDPQDQAMQRALTFVSRTQNLESEFNNTPFPAKNPDGGFYYTPAAGGQSQAGTTEDGGLRSYGSMTYAGLKSMIYAGVKQDDPRVAAAVKWLQKNYSLSENPNMGDAGLYYYYHTFAKALDALGKDEFVDAEGKSHNWRDELTAALASRQQPDGSWVNKNERWMEGNASLVTGYALLALSYAQPK